MQGLLLVMCVCVWEGGLRPHGASTSVRLHGGRWGARMCGASLRLSIRGEGGGGGVSAGVWTGVWLWGVRVWACVRVFVFVSPCVCALRVRVCVGVCV